MSQFRPLEGDKDLPAPQMLIDNIGTEHLLVDTVTTAACEAMKNDGSDWYPCVLIELEGRFNRTEVEGAQKAVLNIEAAIILYQNLEHTLAYLIQEGLI